MSPPCAAGAILAWVAVSLVDEAFSFCCAIAPDAVRRSAAAMLSHVVRITSSLLAQEPIAGRMVRAVNLRVAVHATPPDGAVARGRDLRAVVNRRRVPAADMAALAEHRLLGDEHAIV